MEWYVEVTGNTSDLEQLSKSLVSPECCLTQEKGTFVLKSRSFNQLNDAREVRDRASEIISLINGAANIELAMKEPLLLSGVSCVNDKGKATQFLFPKSIPSQAGVGIPTVLVDGAVQGGHPADVVQTRLQLAGSNRNVKKVLEQWRPNNDWYTLFDVYEIIKEDFGSKQRVANLGKVSKNAITRFTRTANMHRHKVQKEPPPQNPMSLAEAQRFVQRIVRCWLNSK